MYSDLDEEDKQRIAWTKAKKDMKDYQKNKEVVLDELLPKATGKEAMFEKRKMRAEYQLIREYFVISLSLRTTTQRYLKKLKIY